jgi:hypothetical protein
MAASSSTTRMRFIEDGDKVEKWTNGKVEK